ncbi:recombinase family protein [Oceanobacillus sp. 1P07AA]|uniref:recombinase family protein n=1 Tax=Oceanobacillus sp. 1P07AA TaxID=3132293 RepID=UPI0039A5437B
MHHKNYSRKTKENEIVEYRHNNFLFMFTRFKRINWKEYKGFRWGKFKNWSEKSRGGKQSNIELVKGEHPAIIDEELWERVQLLTREHKEKFPKTSNFEGEFVLSGILKCPQCGKGMVMSKIKKEIVMIITYIINAKTSTKKV